MRTLAILALAGATLLCAAVPAPAAAQSAQPSSPIGYQSLHPDQQINYQLNRCLTGGRLGDLRAIAPKIHGFADWKRELTGIAKTALDEGRIHNAAYYYRYSCFFCLPDDPDKLETYRIFVRLIGQEYEHSSLQRFAIPYGEAFLPALRMTPPSPKGTIVLSSGFDTYLEEYIPRVEYFAAHGYDVIVFNGPGQGDVLLNQKIPMTPRWEEPVAAVLDYFHLDDVTLVGVSLGGYLAMRAAAFDARIHRVVAFNVMYDFYGCFRSKVPALVGVLVDAALYARMDPLVNAAARVRMSRDLLSDWFLRQGMTVTGTDSPAAFLREMKRYSTEADSDKVTQDVLILAGAQDHYVPLEQLYRQMDALKNARSITGRIFTTQEHAQNHGQYGNPELALATIVNWIETRAEQ